MVSWLLIESLHKTVYTSGQASNNLFHSGAVSNLGFTWSQAKSHNQQSQCDALAELVKQHGNVAKGTCRNEEPAITIEKYL